MPKGVVETYYADDRWGNLIEGEGPAESFFQHKDPAVEAGRAIARQRRVDHVIQNQDGTVGERNSYASDAD